MKTKTSLARTLASFIRVNPNIESDEFNEFVSHIYQATKQDILTVQLVKDSVITYNYPDKGNEITLGKNIFELSTDKETTINAFRNQVKMIEGPKMLIQKRLGFIYREPIILNDTPKTHWGYAVIVLDIEDFLSNIPIIKNNKDKILFYCSNKGVYNAGFFFGDSTIAENTNISRIIDIPLGKWTIYFKPPNPVENNPIPDSILKTIYFIIALIIGLLIGFIVRAILNTLRKNRLLSEQNTIIQKQLDEKSILIGEIHHRIKNHFQMLSSLNKILYLDIEDEKVHEIINEINNRVYSMASIYDQLRESENNNLALKDYIKSLTENLINTLNSKIQVEIEGEDQSLDIKRTINLGVILTEIITNSLKHAFKENKEGKIKIVLQTNENEYLIKVMDSGNQLPINVLQKHHNSQGIELIKLISNQINAKLSVFKDDDWNGFELRLPY